MKQKVESKHKRHWRKRPVVGIRVTPDLRLALAQIAAIRGSSVARIGEDALCRYVAECAA
jgi:hypothetical protein